MESSGSFSFHGLFGPSLGFRKGELGRDVRPGIRMKVGKCENMTVRSS